MWGYDDDTDYPTNRLLGQTGESWLAGKLPVALRPRGSAASWTGSSESAAPSVHETRALDRDPLFDGSPSPLHPTKGSVKALPERPGEGQPTAFVPNHPGRRD